MYIEYIEMPSYSSNNAMVQYGSGLRDIGTIYRGPQFVQRGRGIGSIFGGLWKHIAPFATSGLRALGKQSLLTGSNVLRDLSDGKKLKNVLQEQAHDAINNLTQKGINKLQKMQSGKGLLAIKARDPHRKRLVGQLGRYGYKRRVSMRGLSSGLSRKKKRGARKLSTQTGEGKRRRKHRIGCTQTGTGRKKRVRVVKRLGGCGAQSGGRRRQQRRGSNKKSRNSRKRKSTRSIDIFDF